LNDAFRSSFTGGRVFLTAGVDALPDVGKSAVLELVRTFRDFDRDNDPHHEHDFLNFQYDGERYFAKIDYYAPSMNAGSDDPSDPEKTARVLTIMRADEY